MEASSSNSKDKGRASDHSHLRPHGRDDPESKETIDYGINWGSSVNSLPPLERVFSHSEDTSDNLGGCEEQRSPLNHVVTAGALGSLIRKRYANSGGTLESHQAMHGGKRDTDVIAQPKKRHITFEDGVERPPTRRDHLPQLEADGNQQPPLYASSRYLRDSAFEEDFNHEGASDDAPTCPSSPRPRHRELHPARTTIGEGNLSIEDIDADEIAFFEEVEDIASEAELDSEIARWVVGAKPFIVYGFFTTRLWHGSLATNVIQHPPVHQLFRTCLLTSPGLYFLYKTLLRHNGQWYYTFDAEYTNYGAVRKAYLIAVLEPVYQAGIDLRHRLLARTFLTYASREQLAGGDVCRNTETQTVVPDTLSAAQHPDAVGTCCEPRRRKANNTIKRTRTPGFRGGSDGLSNMADQVTGLAGGATNGLPLGGGLGAITGVLQGSIGNLLNTGQGYLDRWFPPEKRESLKQQLTKFATERPKLAAFILSQIALSGLPLGLFIVMTITVVLFALIAGLLVGLLGAVLFIVFALGFALCILLPTLFFTTFAATFIFLFGLGAYYIVKWFNEESIPGIHTPLAQGVKEKMGLADVPALNGEAPPPPPASERNLAPASGKPRPPKIEKHGKEDADDEKENKPPRSHKEAPNSAKKQHTSSNKSPAADVTNNVGNATNALDGAGGELRKKTAGLGA